MRLTKEEILAFVEENIMLKKVDGEIGISLIRVDVETVVGHVGRASSARCVHRHVDKAGSVGLVDGHVDWAASVGDVGSLGLLAMRKLNRESK